MITILSRRRIKHEGYSRYLYLCSDKIERTIDELAKLAGVTPNTITIRIGRYGLTHELILSGYVQAGFSLKSKIKRNKSTKSGNAEWQALEN